MSQPARSFNMSISIPFELYQSFGNHLHDLGGTGDLSTMASLAIRQWMASNKPSNTSSEAGSLMCGYQWKKVYLPDGTKLRTSFAGNDFHATVKGNTVQFNDMVLSPSQFANHVSRSRRNAWRVIWLLFPDSATWKLASTCRNVVSENA